MRKLTLLLCLLLAIGATGQIAALAADSLTAEQRAAVAALDVRLGAVEKIAASIDDASYNAEVARQIDELKKSRVAIEKDFDQGRYETLMHSVISRYQVVALWLKSPLLPAPPYDIALLGGRIVDGTGAPWYIADI